MMSTTPYKGFQGTPDKSSILAFTIILRRKRKLHCSKEQLTDFLSSHERRGKKTKLLQLRFQKLQKVILRNQPRMILDKVRKSILIFDIIFDCEVCLGRQNISFFFQKVIEYLEEK